MAPAGLESYDEDDFVDQYDSDVDEGQDELSPEDKLAMENGTAEVRQALGADAIKVKLNQIQDALWHYYYDVDKSVAYLKRTFITPVPPKSTPKKTIDGKLRLVSFYSEHGLFASTTGADHEVPHYRHRPCSLDRSSLVEYNRTRIFVKANVRDTRREFADMPWLNIPKHREATFIPPLALSGGLLGGSEAAPKMSKLQALAAARKKKTENQKEYDKISQTKTSVKRLSFADRLDKENTQFAMSGAKPPSAPTEFTQTLREQEGKSIKATFSDSPKSQNKTEDVGRETNATIEEDNSLDGFYKSASGVTVAQENLVPSAFAQTLLGSAPDARQKRRPDTFAMPYISSPSYLAKAFSEPSPDDIVLAAQAQAGKKTTTPKPLKRAAKADDALVKADVINGVSSLKVTDVLQPKNKGLDVIKEFEGSSSKRSTSFVVVGHVDAGKSTLMGRLLLELNYIEERTVDKYRRQAEKSGKQSFALAWVMDQRSEERDRGVTIDIATNHFETETTRFTILDAPGHRDFVPNMIAGASQADFAVLVIDANTGAFEKGLKGQTREHVLLLRSLGIQRLVVAVNKLDMVGWSQGRFEEISQQVTGFLTGLGFQSKHVSFIPISGLNGGNIVRKVEDAEAVWYKGMTLIEALEASGPSTTRALTKPFRMGISEVFRSQQGVTTLAGRIDSGTVQVGDVVFVQPSGESAYIKSIVVDTDSQDWAVAGQNPSIALTDIDPIHIRIGDILCHPADAIKCGDTFTMKAMAFDHLMPMPVDLHRGRLHAAGQIQSISATLDKATGEIVKRKPKVVQPGAVARVVIKVGVKVPLESGQRVVIRSSGETIAAGLLE